MTYQSCRISFLCFMMSYPQVSAWVFACWCCSCWSTTLTVAHSEACSRAASHCRSRSPAPAVCLSCPPALILHNSHLCFWLLRTLQDFEDCLLWCLSDFALSLLICGLIQLCVSFLAILLTRKAPSSCWAALLPRLNFCCDTGFSSVSSGWMSGAAVFCLCCNSTAALLCWCRSEIGCELIVGLVAFCRSKC